MVSVEALFLQPSPNLDFTIRDPRSVIYDLGRALGYTLRYNSCKGGAGISFSVLHDASHARKSFTYRPAAIVTHWVYKHPLY
ncbi:MAG: hypothetical protein P4L95_21405 [Rouxiella aceris]|uniref:hypothetical protein n=1 Tax=Rouxiella aceris TaxID=2703884 RepID=UPI00284184BA|nr:hypothetical protein [Rouxiella aceris]MDR3434422.1 hypothetical protein [Rouxiella aceris]